MNQTEKKGNPGGADAPGFQKRKANECDDGSQHTAHSSACQGQCSINERLDAMQKEISALKDKLYKLEATAAHFEFILKYYNERLIAIERGQDD